MNVKDFFNVLFDAGEKINIRVIKDDNSGAENKLFAMPDVALFQSYKDAFPCCGINPRETRKKLSAIKNLVIDIDGHDLPEWSQHADMICSRDEKHHHLYFCFTPTDRETYKKITAQFIKNNTSVDKMVSDPERVMRLPYFAHRKEGKENEGYKVVFINKNIERVSIEKKFSWMRAADKDAPAVQEPASVINYIRSVYKRKPLLCKGDGRSRELFFIGLDCHTWGVSFESALLLAQELSEERHDPPESHAIIKKQIDSAYRYAKGEFGAALQNGGTTAQQQKEKKFFEQTQRVREKLSTWVYIHSACRFVDTSTGRSLTARDQIEDFISHEIGEPVNLRKLLSASALETCDTIEYAPREKEKTYIANGIKYFNSYRPNAAAMKKDESLKLAAPQAFIEHVNFIGTSPEERKTLLEYFAFCVQNVGEKVDWTPLIISPREGLGKSAFSCLFRYIFGDHNCSTVSAHKLLSGWTDFVAEKLFVVSHEVETNETAALTELKTLITESRVSVNAKYARTYETHNCANFLLLSNKMSALRLEKNSRRFFVIVNKNDPREKAYYNNLFNCIENGAGWIYEYLLSVDLSKFDPHGAAPETEGLKMLVDTARPEAIVWLDEQVEYKTGAFAEKIVEIREIKRAAERSTDIDAKYLTPKVIASYLHGIGYAPREYWIKGEHRRGWFKGTDEAFTEAIEAMRGGKTEQHDTNAPMI